MNLRRVLPFLFPLLATGGPACGPEFVDDHEAEVEPYDDGSNILEQGLIDCSTRQDTGYRNGTAFPITVVTVDGKPAEIATANAYWVMQQAAARAGVSIRIVSGFRTMAQQQYLYSCYTNCNCNNCNLAARPGYSNHQSGHALDLNTSQSGVLTWLNNHGATYGFRRTVPSEAWHWEWWGGGPGGGPCGASSGGGTQRRVVGVTYNAAEGSTARLADATVKLLKNGQQVGNTTSSATGYWSFNVNDSGPFTVVATRAGYLEARRDVTASSAEDNWASVGLQPAVASTTGTYRGVVYSGATAGEDPVGGATVRLSTGQSVVVGADGVFRFDIPAGQITATATRTGYVTNSVTRTITAGQVTWGSIRITPQAPSQPPPPEPLEIPQLLAPAPGDNVDPASLVLSWSRVEHDAYPTITYDVEVHPQGSPADAVVSLVVPQPASGSVSAAVVTTLAPGAYGWRVRAKATGATGDWSVIGRFVVPEPVQEPAAADGGMTEMFPEGPPEAEGPPPDDDTPPGNEAPPTDPAPSTEEDDAPAGPGCSQSAGSTWLPLGLAVLLRRRRR